MQAFAKFATLPDLLRRACLCMRPSLTLIMPVRTHARPAEDLALAECDASVAAFRVTDRRRSWSRVSYFADGPAAARYASLQGGVVWERYVGPTGAPNWWSLTEHEWQAHLDAHAADPRASAALSRR